MPTLVQYVLFLTVSDVCRSLVIKHSAKSNAELCRCFDLVNRDHVITYVFPRSVWPVLQSTSSDAFIGGSDVQNFIAHECVFLTIRATCANGCRGHDRQPTSHTDSIPFVEKFMKQCCHRLHELAAPNLARRWTALDALFEEIINELSRLHLPRHDLSSIVAASADVVQRKLVACGASDVEDRWSTYARLPREYSTGSSSRCVGGRLVLSAAAALEPQLQRDIVADMQNLRVTDV